jgi:hypothetical protein
VVDGVIGGAIGGAIGGVIVGVAGTVLVGTALLFYFNFIKK